MMVVRTEKNSFLIEISGAELDTLINCMNESCNGIHVAEFKTRVGVTKDEARVLLDRLVTAANLAINRY